MAKIPETSAFGARQSLQSNRLDMPGESEAIVADSVLRAADNFTKIIAERKGKNDRLAYSKAKIDLSAADARIRRELEEGGDWENYSRDYRERMNEILPEISSRITDPNDAVIFDAESNLTVERGDSAMSEARMIRARDERSAEIMSYGQELRRSILRERTNKARIGLLLDYQEFVNASVEELGVDASWAQAQIQEFVRDTSIAQLKTLPLRTQLQALEASIDANPDPNSPDFQPTGSLADFLQQNERIELHEKVAKQLEEEEDMGIAQATHDRIVAENRATSPESYRARRDALKNDKTLTPQQREKARQMLDRTEGADERYVAGVQQEIVTKYSELIREGKPGPMYFDADAGEMVEDPRGRESFTHDDIPRSEWTQLTGQQRALLEGMSNAREQGRPFAPITQKIKRPSESGIMLMDGTIIKELPSASLWDRLGNKRLQVDLDDPQWLTAFSEADIDRMRGEQKLLQQNKGPDLNDIDNNKSLLLSALVAKGWVRKGDRPPEEDQIYAANLLEFNRRIYQEQVSKGIDNAIGYPDYGTREAILAELMTRKAFTDKGILDIQDADPDEMMEFQKMTPAQREAGWMPLTGGPPGTNAQEQRYPVFNDKGEVVEWMNAEAWLVARAKMSREDGGLGMKVRPDDDALRSAWFALYNNMGMDEVLKRLEGD